MKKVVCFIVLLLFLFPTGVMAHPGRTDSSGCHVCRTNCSKWGLYNGQRHCHGGSSSSSSSSSSSNSSAGYTRKVVTPTYIYGCMDSSALNYNSKATKDDGSCIAKKYGCMDTNATNYDSSANVNDDSCEYKKIMTKSKKIPFETIYKNNDNLVKGTEKVSTDGKDGKKEITYEAITDKNGKIISKEKVNEKVVVKPINKVVEKGTMGNDTTGVWLWIISLIIVIYYTSKHGDGNLLLNKINKFDKRLRILLYIVYALLVLPVFVDVILLIINLIKNRISK